MKNLIYIAYLLPVSFLAYTLLHDKNDCETKIVEAAETTLQDTYLGKNDADKKNKEAEASCQKSANKAEFLSKLLSI